MSTLRLGNDSIHSARTYLSHLLHMHYDKIFYHVPHNPTLIQDLSFNVQKRWKNARIYISFHLHTSEDGLFSDIFLTYLVHPKPLFAYKGDSNVLIQNIELRDSEIHIRNISFLVAV